MRLPTGRRHDGRDRCAARPAQQRKRKSLIVDPPNGRYPAMTPEGQKRADLIAAGRNDTNLGQPHADSYEDRPLAERTGAQGSCGRRGFCLSKARSSHSFRSVRMRRNTLSSEPKGFLPLQCETCGRASPGRSVESAGPRSLRLRYRAR